MATLQASSAKRGGSDVVQIETYDRYYSELLHSKFWVGHP
jgi:hypothetical protein